MKYIKEKTRKYKANKIIEMSQKELMYHQKTNRAAVEQHRAIKNLKKKQLLQSKYLRQHKLLEKQKTD